MLSRRSILLGLASSVAPIAIASSADPYLLHEDPDNPGYSDLSGKIESSTALNSGESTGLFIVNGQSNAGNHASASPHAVTHPLKVDNLNIYDGHMYRAADPMLGPSGNAVSWMPRLGDALIDAGIFARVIFCPIAIAGRPIAYYAAGGPLHHRFGVALLRCSRIEMPVTGILWQQGESDIATPKQIYKAHVRTMRDTAREMGCVAPFFLAKSTMYNGNVNPTVQTAIDELIAQEPDDFRPGADCDSLTVAGGNRAGDGTHLSEAGTNNTAKLWRDAIARNFGPGGFETVGRHDRG